MILFGWAGLLLGQTRPPLGTTAEIKATDGWLQLRLPSQDNAQLLAAEQQAARPGRAPRFAEPVRFQWDLVQQGQWQEWGSDSLRCRFRVVSAGAHSLNLGFSGFYLPPGARLWLYDPQRTDQHGPFTARDNDEHGQFWSPLVLGDTLCLELHLPKAEKEALVLELAQVNHDFGGLARTVLNECMVDVACGSAQGLPAIENFRLPIQSVGLITIDGIGYCTGYLVNTVEENCTPYFVTANHCNLDAPTAASMVVYWNYQNSTCRPRSTAQNGGTGNGVFNIFNTGAIRRAANTQSDFLLLELDDPIPAAAEAYFAGWSVSEVLPTGTIAAIHHADGLEKRISLSRQQVYIGTWNTGVRPINGGNHLILPSWEVGSTARGSSGGPLFDQQGQVVGQLHGGESSCTDAGFDSFGWFRYSYLAGGNAQSRLRDWLNPRNLMVNSWRGLPEKRCRFALSSNIKSQTVCLNQAVTFALSVENPFPDSLRLRIRDLPLGWTASFSPARLLSGPSLLTVVPQQGNGFYALVLEAIRQNDTVRTTIFLTIEGPLTPPSLLGPNQGTPQDLPVRLRWRQVPRASTYTVLVARDSGLRQLVYQSNTIDTTILINDLPLGQTFFWSVKAFNTCDTLKARTVFAFSTHPDVRLLASTGALTRCQNEALAFDLQVGRGFDAPVQLSYRLEPPGQLPWTYSQAPAQVAPGGRVQVGLPNLSLLSPGRYQLTWLARTARFRDSTTIALTVGGAPSRPGVVAPLPNQVLLLSRPEFKWGATNGASEYQLVVATDSALGNPLASRTVAGTALSWPTDLSPGQYYWQLTARNACGTALGEVQSFAISTSNLGVINNIRATVTPIPSDGWVEWHLSAPLEQAILEVRTLTGQLLYREAPTSSFQTYRLDLSSLPNGVYLLRLLHRRSSLTQRVILQR